MSQAREVADLRPITVPLAALLRTLGEAWAEGVDAGITRGTGAHAERAARVDGYLSRLLVDAYAFCAAESRGQAQGEQDDDEPVVRSE